MKTQHLLTLLALLGAATACRPSLELSPEESTWHDAAEKWPDAPAVVLLDEIELLNLSRDDTSYANLRVRRVLHVRHRDALEAANIRIRQYEGRELTAFRARSIAPDGKVRSIGPEALAAAPVEEGGEDAGAFLTAAVPGVVVGSTVEYEFVMRNKGWWPTLSYDYDSAYPIVEARARIAITDPIQHATKVYNTNQKVTVRRDGPLRYIEWSQRDIPMPLAEVDAPGDDHWPRLRFRVKQVVSGTLQMDLARHWRDVLADRIEALTDDDHDPFYAGYEAPAMPACPGDAAGRAACLVDAALAIARDRVVFTGFGGWGSIRSLDDVLEAGEGTGFEKAVLVSRLLRDAGLEVEHGFTVRSLRRDIDHAFPAASDLDHLVLRLPVQPGINEPLWIDPACEHCRAGTLPEWSRGFQAIVLDEENAEDDEGSARVVAIGEARARPDVVAHRSRVTIADDDTATVEHEERREGGPAQSTARAVRGLHDWEHREEADELAEFIDERARLDAHTPFTCDRAVGECRRTLRASIPGYAWRAGDALRVPLSVMFQSEGYPDLPEPKRSRDHIVPASVSFIETVEVPVPKGYVFAGGPTANDTPGDAFSARLEVSCRDGIVTLVQRTEARRGRYTPAAIETRRAPLIAAIHTRDDHLRFRRTDGPGGCRESDADRPVSRR